MCHHKMKVAKNRSNFKLMLDEDRDRDLFFVIFVFGVQPEIYQLASPHGVLSS